MDNKNSVDCPKEPENCMLVLVKREGESCFVSDILVCREDQMDFIRQNTDWHSLVTLPTSVFKKAELLYMR